MRDRV